MKQRVNQTFVPLNPCHVTFKNAYFKSWERKALKSHAQWMARGVDSEIKVKITMSKENNNYISKLVLIGPNSGVSLQLKSKSKRIIFEKTLTALRKAIKEKQKNGWLTR